jgi:hypothetical protein
MGKSGKALSLVTPEDSPSLQGIERNLGVRLGRVRIDRFAALHLGADKPQPTVWPPVAHGPSRHARGSKPRLSSHKIVVAASSR